MHPPLFHFGSFCKACCFVELNISDSRLSFSVTYFDSQQNRLNELTIWLSLGSKLPQNQGSVTQNSFLTHSIWSCHKIHVNLQEKLPSLQNWKLKYIVRLNTKWNTTANDTSLDNLLYGKKILVLWNHSFLSTSVSVRDACTLKQLDWVQQIKALFVWCLSVCGCVQILLHFKCHSLNSQTSFCGLTFTSADWK